METTIGRGGARHNLSHAWRKYAAVLRVSIANNLAYMMEVFFRALLLIVLVVVIGQLWKTTFSARGATTLSGFTISDMIWYLVATHSHTWVISRVRAKRLFPRPPGVDMR